MSNCTCEELPQIVVDALADMNSPPYDVVPAVQPDWARYVVLDPGYQEASTWFYAVSPDETKIQLYDTFTVNTCTADVWARQVLDRLAGVTAAAFIINAKTGRQGMVGVNARVCEVYWKALQKFKSILPPAGPMGGFFPATIFFPVTIGREKQVRSSAEAVAQNANTYTVCVLCENCGFTGRVSLTKETRVSQAICQTCGCGELRLLDKSEETQGPAVTFEQAMEHDFSQVDFMKYQAAASGKPQSIYPCGRNDCPASVFM